MTPVLFKLIAQEDTIRGLTDIASQAELLGCTAKYSVHYALDGDFEDALLTPFHTAPEHFLCCDRGPDARPQMFEIFRVTVHSFRNVNG